MRILYRRTVTQHLHRKSERYRNAIRRKLAGYQLNFELGLIG